MFGSGRRKLRNFFAALALIAGPGATSPALSQIPKEHFELMQHLIQVNNWKPREKEMAARVLAHFSKYSVLINKTKKGLSDLKEVEEKFCKI